MAKQNFLAGGYYGKLGDTVGQRWKNIRTIRSYVIPHNPKTPLQQANRKSFGEVVPYAQLGNDANFNCPAFDLSVNTQWAFRMQQGTELQRSGESGLNLIPLYPKNFVVPNTISQITINGIVTNTSISIQIAGDVPETKRQISLFLMFADGARKNEIILLAGESTDAQPNVFTCPCADTSEIDTATIYGRVCSRDDTVTDTITASVQLLCGKDLSKAFLTQITLAEKTVADDGTITIVVATQNAYSATTYGTVSVSGTTSIFNANTKAGGTESGMQWGTNVNLMAVNYNGLHAFMFSQKRSNAKAEYKNAEINFNIELAFTDYHTDLTDAVTATSETTTTATWQNKQPNYSLTIASATAGTYRNDKAFIDIKCDTPANYQTALEVAVSVSGQISLKDTWDYDSGTLNYIEKFRNVENTDIFNIDEVVKTSDGLKVYIKAANWAMINTYKIKAQLTLTVTNGYNDDTMPASVTATTAQITMPEDWQQDSLESIFKTAAPKVKNLTTFEDGSAGCKLDWGTTINGLDVYADGILEDCIESSSGTITFDGTVYDISTLDDFSLSFTSEEESEVPVSNGYYGVMLRIENVEPSGTLNAMNLSAKIAFYDNVFYCSKYKAWVVPRSPIFRSNQFTLIKTNG